MNRQRLIEWFCRWLVGGAFIYAALMKILVPCELGLDIYHYRLAPGFLINIVAIILPVIEIILGTALITGIASRGAALGLALVLSFFIVLLTINIIRGIDFECSCFGNQESDICQKFAEFFKAGQPGMDRITFVRIRTACDVLRDILLLIASMSALTLMNRRQAARKGARS